MMNYVFGIVFLICGLATAGEDLNSALLFIVIGKLCFIHDSIGRKDEDSI